METQSTIKEEDIKPEIIESVEIEVKPWTLPPSIGSDGPSSYYTLQASVVGEVMETQSTIKEEDIKAEIIESDEVEVKPWTLPPSSYYTLQASVADEVTKTQPTIKEEVIIKAEIVESDEIEVEYLPVKIESVTMKNMLKCDECERTFLKTWALMSHKRSHSRQKPFKPTSIVKEEVVIEGYGLTEVEENAEIKVLDKDGEESLNTSRPISREEEMPETKTGAYSSCFESMSYRVIKQPGENPGPKSFVCSECIFSCSKLADFKRHIMTHTGEKPFSCSDCSYSSSRKSNLTQHMMKHTSKKTLFCSDCSYSSSRKSSLTQHMMKHTSEKPLFCPDCSYSFSQKSSLKQHMMMHSDVKPLSCSECCYSCFNKSILKQHVMTHTSKKTFSCSNCSYSCSKKSRLKEHMMIHSGIKPISCPECSYSCCRKSRLNKHIFAKHYRDSSVYSLSCSECSFTCSRESSLNKHIMYHVLLNQF